MVKANATALKLASDREGRKEGRGERIMVTSCPEAERLLTCGVSLMMFIEVRRVDVYIYYLTMR
jgi:hypothetical protein